jgi:hypothetical protein
MRYHGCWLVVVALATVGVVVAEESTTKFSNESEFGLVPLQR